MFTLNIPDVRQLGHACKLAALASVDHYWQAQIGQSGLPLRKAKQFPLSLREISKSFGSLQGELLTIQQLVNIAQAIGYQAHWIDCKNDEKLYGDTIREYLTEKEKTPIIAFIYDQRQYERVPDTPACREHAMVLYGFNQGNNKVAACNNGNHIYLTMSDLFASSARLSATRGAEYYRKIQPTDMPGIQHYKYHNLYLGPEGQTPHYQQSLIPGAGSGFQSKLLIIQPDTSRTRDACLQHLQTVQCPRTKLLTRRLKKYLVRPEQVLSKQQVSLLKKNIARQFLSEILLRREPTKVEIIAVLRQVLALNRHHNVWFEGQLVSIIKDIGVAIGMTDEELASAYS